MQSSLLGSNCRNPFFCVCILIHTFAVDPPFTLCSPKVGYTVEYNSDRFEIYFFGIGPTEIRVAIIALNTSIIFLGTSWWPVTVPLFTALLALGLIFMIFRTQKELWRIDMEAKRASQKGPEDS